MTGVMLLCSVCLKAQTTNYDGKPISLEECRQMALRQSKELDQARIKEEMAGYDRKIAMANYFPKISATGGYLYNNRDVKLISDEQSERLRNAGTTLDNDIWNGLSMRVDKMESGRMKELGHSVLDMFRNSPDKIDIASPINAIGEEIDAILHPDLHNILAGAITVEQPVFVGGKIIYSNQMAALARQLAKSQYDMKEADILLDVDQAYWQIISISEKKKLAQSYSELLTHMLEDVDAAISAGVSTQSDALQVKVKANEAAMLLTKATNGLALAKMLLCQRIGLPLDSDIILADEGTDTIPEPVTPVQASMEDIYATRPETRSLTLASQIYDRKARIARADMMPTVALVGAYTITNPNCFNGFQNTWQGGNLSAGVVLRIPIFHGGESLYKYKKAKAEARQYTDQLDDAREMIGLQVSQQRKLFAEARQKLEMADSNLDSAEENLRSAKVGYDAGLITTNTVLAAHTAWLSAHSEFIDAGIQLQMCASSLRKAEGQLNSNNYEPQEKL